jgi:hypothetical protein
MSLEEQLCEIARRSQETIPVKVMEVIRKQVDDLAESAILERCIKVSATMPDSELLDTQGNTVCLKELWARGPLVLSFYRGGW